MRCKNCTDGTVLRNVARAATDEEKAGMAYPDLPIVELMEVECDCCGGKPANCENCNAGRRVVDWDKPVSARLKSPGSHKWLMEVGKPEPKKQNIFNIGDECPNCKDSKHTGVWSGEFYMICPVCGDSGVLDEKALVILKKQKG